MTRRFMQKLTPVAGYFSYEAILTRNFVYNIQKPRKKNKLEVKSKG